MSRFVAVVALGLLAAGCLIQTEPLRPTENGVWIEVKNTSFDKVWAAASTVMARHFEVTEPDAEMGTIVGQDREYFFSYTKKVKFFIWPTESSDAGYSVDVDEFLGRSWYQEPTDWKKVIIEDIRKELGAS